MTMLNHGQETLMNALGSSSVELPRKMASLLIRS